MSGMTRKFLLAALVFIVDGSLGILKISFKRFLHISILKNTLTPLHDHVRKRMGWSDEQVVARWLILQAVASALLLLSCKNAFSVIPHFAKMSLSCEFGFSRSPMNRCSTEIYSSFICFAFSSAAVNALSTSGDTYTFSGSLPLPVTFGIPAALCSVSLVSCEASAPIFFIS